MMKIASVLQSFALTFGGALSFSYAECPSWDELLAEESVIEVNIARRATMFAGLCQPIPAGRLLCGR